MRIKTIEITAYAEKMKSDNKKQVAFMANAINLLKNCSISKSSKLISSYKKQNPQSKANHYQARNFIENQNFV